MRRIVILLAGLGMLMACGSDAVRTAATETVSDEAVEVADASSEAESNDGDANAASTEQPTATPVEAADEDEEAAAVEPQRLELEPADWTGLTEWRVPAMGGLTFGVPDGVTIHHDGDLVSIRKTSVIDSAGQNPNVKIARVYQTATGTPVTLANITSSLIAGIGSATPTNTTLSLFGEELDGWQFTVNEDKGEGPFFTFSAYPEGTNGPSSWDPFPLGELFLADVPGGVLVIGWSGRDDDALAEARAIFDRVAPTLSLSRPFSDTADPVTPFLKGDTAPPPEPVALPQGWPSELTQLSTELDMDEYSVLGFNTAFSLSLEDQWFVQPNFPGWLVLTAAESGGPGDRDVVFRAGATSLVPVLREGASGEGQDFDPQVFATDPPENIEIVETEEVEIGGATGLRVRFVFDQSADCAAMEVCEYWLVTDNPYPPASIRAGYQHELWYLDGELVEPLTMLVGTNISGWFDRARTLIDTIEFDIAN